MRSQTEPTEQGGPVRVVTLPAPTSDALSTKRSESEAEVVLDDLLVEDVSIDGMCGVY